MRLVICEKPSVAKSISAVLGAKERGDDYKHINRQDKEVENIHYLPKNPDLLKNILSNDRADRNKIRAASFKRHLSTLNNVINKESSVMAKLKDSEQTVKFTESQKSKSNKNKGIEL